WPLPDRAGPRGWGLARATLAWRAPAWVTPLCFETPWYAIRSGNQRALNAARRTTRSSVRRDRLANGLTLGDADRFHRPGAERKKWLRFRKARFGEAER